MISGFLFNLSLVGQALSRQVGKGSDKLNSLANSPLPAKKLRSLLKVRNNTKLQNQGSEDVTYCQQGLNDDCATTIFFHLNI